MAVPYAANGVFGHQGQMCVAASRLYVQSGIYDEFVKRAVDYAKNIKIGPPEDASTQHGPQIPQTLFLINYFKRLCFLSKPLNKNLLD